MPAYLRNSHSQVKKWGGRRERQKCRHAIAKCSDSPICWKKSEKRFVFLSGAAISSRLIDLSFCSDSFSACTYIYIIEFIYIYGCFNGS